MGSLFGGQIKLPFISQKQQDPEDDELEVPSHLPVTIIPETTQAGEVPLTHTLMPDGGQTNL